MSHNLLAAKRNPAIARNELTKHTSEYGTDALDWLTNHKDAYRKTNGTSSKLNAELLNDLRKNHFNYGSSQNEYHSSSNEIGRRLCKPSKLDQKLEKDLKAHHFGENDEMEYKTIHREQYFWKVNPEY